MVMNIENQRFLNTLCVYKHRALVENALHLDALLIMDIVLGIENNNNINEVMNYLTNDKKKWKMDEVYSRDETSTYCGPSWIILKAHHFKFRWHVASSLDMHMTNIDNSN